ncbi:DUF1800 domain-containing protein [Inhella sp.]|uniref:DUF1800 domain-containing protein n=1 Tax=Inhella sp. TaxID=1921806 RepID=UPI0035B4E1F2
MKLLRRTLFCLPALGLSLGAQASPAAETLHACNRLGYGPRPGDLARGGSWPELLEQQLQPQPLPAALQQRLDARPAVNLAERAQAFRQLQRQQRAEDEAPRRELIRQALHEAAEARLLRALESPNQLEERLVDFWFNHFNVFFDKGLCRMLVADYEARAIRPHVFGRFRDLLGAVATHPAMLFYLDNAQSTRAGFQGAGGSRGLNENYARELMELHTLGVGAGYGQQDVTELARVLTGWTFRPRDLQFMFDPRRHDEDPKTWLGQSVPGRGRAQGEWVLDQLARHPATAQRIAFKLGQHFLADEPPAAAVAAARAAFLASDGDLRATVAALLRHPEARQPALQGAQFKTPQRFVISLLRACAITPADWTPTLQALRALGQPLFGCVTPDGYKTVRSAWLDPEALARRAELAARVAQRARLGAEAAEQLLETLGPAIGSAARSAIAQEPPQLRTALILGSPDFQNC